MSCDEVYVDYLLELLSPVGDVTTKRMFGGVGFFKNSLMFALVADSTFYLKVDDENRAEFEALDLEPFVYEKTNKSVTMSYYQAPEDAVDDNDTMLGWASSAIRAAERARQKKEKSVKTIESPSDSDALAAAASKRLHVEQDIDAMVADTDVDELSLDGEFA